MTPKLMLDIQGDQVVVTGPREAVSRAIDLHLLNYVEIDGFIQATVPDPIPHRGREIANAAMSFTRSREGREGGI